MKYTLFAPKGLYKNEAGKPLAEAIHETALKLFAKYDRSGGSFETEPGSLVDLVSFMLAIAFARIAATRDKLNGERFALGAYYLLRQLEQEHGLQPSAEDTLRARRLALADAKRAPRGSAGPELEQQLRDLLGDAYIGTHVASGAEIVAWPEELGDQPQLLLPPEVDRKVVILATAISTDLGASQVVQYLAVDPIAATSTTHTLQVGDQLVVEPEIVGRTEVVTVEALSASSDGIYLTATFNQAHEPGCVAAQMPFPAWASSVRHLLVALTEEAASDAETRRKVNQKLRKILTGVTTWDLCPSADGLTMGPWTIGDALLGRLGFNPLTQTTVS